MNLVVSVIGNHSDSPALCLASLSPMQLADLMLLELLARGYGTLRLEPRSDEHAFLIFDGGGAQPVADVPSSLATAAIERLALIAGLAIAPPTVGRIRLHLASHRGTAESATFETLIALRATRSGLACELHALSGAPREEDAAAVAGIDGLPTPQQQSVKYQVQGELGRGGMGIVYRARHTALDKEVALKVLSPAMACRKKLAAQFVVEGRAACRARHPAIVDVTDFGRLSDGRNYLVMELVEWPSLAEEIAAGPLPLPRVLSIAIDMARGLAAAHAQGVVHRDLKPANVFVSDDGRVKVGDFGLAYTADLVTDGLEGICFGTAPYMAPELLDGSGGPPADLYAFGCIVHELVTGVPPYGHASTQEVLDGHRSAPIPVLGGDSDGAGLARLTDLQQRLLAKEPTERPSSFDEVIAELEVLMEELS